MEGCPNVFSGVVSQEKGKRSLDTGGDDKVAIIVINTPQEFVTCHMSFPTCTDEKQNAVHSARRETPYSKLQFFTISLNHLCIFVPQIVCQKQPQTSLKMGNVFQDFLSHQETT